MPRFPMQFIYTTLFYFLNPWKIFKNLKKIFPRVAMSDRTSCDDENVL